MQQSKMVHESILQWALQRRRAKLVGGALHGWRRVVLLAQYDRQAADAATAFHTSR